MKQVIRKKSLTVLATLTLGLTLQATAYAGIGAGVSVGGGIGSGAGISLEGNIGTGASVTGSIGSGATAGNGSASAASADAGGNDPLSACYQTDGAKGRAAVTMCLARTLAQAELALRSVELAHQKAVFAMPADSSSQVRKQSLQGVRPAFVQYRKSLCGLRQAMLLPGSGAGDAELSCEIEMTRQHTRLLGSN